MVFITYLILKIFKSQMTLNVISLLIQNDYSLQTKNVKTLMDKNIKSSFT